MKSNRTKRGIILTICFLIALLIGYHIYARTSSVVSLDVLSKVSRHNEDVSIYVDFGIDSSKPRFFVYDNRKKELLSFSKCTHGSGGGSTVSKPVFSNKPHSNCSSLGECKLTHNSKLNNLDMPCIRIQGLSKTNSNVASRGVVIHEAPFFADDISIGIPIPVSPYICQGCFGISTKTFNQLQGLVKANKSIYLYAVSKGKGNSLFQTK